MQGRRRADGRPIIDDAYCELQKLGEFGPQGLRLLVDLVGQDVRRFPVLLGTGATWTTEAVAEWTQEFFAAKGQAVTAALLAQVTDLDSMARYLRRSIRHFLVDAARDTPSGRSAARSRICSLPHRNS